MWPRSRRRARFARYRPPRRPAAGHGRLRRRGALTSNGRGPDIVLTSSRDARDFGSLVERVRRARLRPQGRDLGGGDRSTARMRAPPGSGSSSSRRRWPPAAGRVALAATSDHSNSRRRTSCWGARRLRVHLRGARRAHAAAGEPHRAAAHRRRVRLVPERAVVLEQLIRLDGRLRPRGRSGPPSSCTPCSRTRAGGSARPAIARSSSPATSSPALRTSCSASSTRTRRPARTAPRTRRSSADSHTAANVAI